VSLALLAGAQELAMVLLLTHKSDIRPFSGERLFAILLMSY
jgi:hypothetical protein